jgi:hypothetical protein
MRIFFALIAALLLGSIIYARACAVLAFNPANPAASGFANIFQDLFPGAALNNANWCPNYPNATSCLALGGSTNANQNASCDPAHTTVSGGAAHMLVTNTASNGYPNDGACMNTDGDPETRAGNPLHSFQPPAGATGAIWIEVQMTLPDNGCGASTCSVTGGVANEPSIFMGGVTPGAAICQTGWPTCGEIDIAEFYGNNNNQDNHGGNCTSYHHDPTDYNLSLLTVGAATARTTCTNGNFTGTHYYGVLWMNASITFYFDRNPIFTTTNVVASSPMYLIIFNITDTRVVDVTPSTIDIHSVNVWSHT